MTLKSLGYCWKDASLRSQTHHGCFLLFAANTEQHKFEKYFVFVGLCAHICVFASVFVCTYMCLCAHIYVCLPLCLFAHIYVFFPLCLCTVCTHICVCLCVCVFRCLLSVIKIAAGAAVSHPRLSSIITITYNHNDNDNQDLWPVLLFHLIIRTYVLLFHLGSDQ